MIYRMNKYVKCFEGLLLPTFLHLFSYWWPFWPPSEAPYPCRKLKENPWIDFLRLSWLAVLLVSLYGWQWWWWSHARWWPCSSYRLTETCTLGLEHPSLTLDIHVKVNCHLSKQGISWPVSHYHIPGSSSKLIKVICFFKLIADQ